MQFTVFVCPNAIVAKSSSVIFSVFFTIPGVSPGRSTPDLDPRPNNFIYLFKVSAPSFSPSCIKATLHEF